MKKKSDARSVKPFAIEMLEEIAPDQLEQVNGGARHKKSTIPTMCPSYIGPGGQVQGDF